MQTIPENVKDIIFRYSKSAPSPIHGKLTGKTFPVSHVTVATIIYNDGSESSGVSYCSVKDKYDPNKGRLIAVNRALGRGKIRSYQVIKDWLRNKDTQNKHRKLLQTIV